MVRDLAWVISSPHMLALFDSAPTKNCDSKVANRETLLADAFSLELAAHSQPWLAALDADPAPLLNFLRRCRGVNRLGFYFAGLLEFGMSACPALGPAAAVLSAPATTVVAARPGPGGGGEIVVGSLKLLLAADVSAPLRMLLPAGADCARDDGGGGRARLHLEVREGGSPRRRRATLR